MAIVHKSDLQNINSSAGLSYIEKKAEESQKLSNAISNFITNTQTKLKGGGYDAVRSKMSLYIDALNKQSQICSNLKNNIVSANNFMMNYMEEFDSLDNSKLSEIKQSYNNAKNKLIELRGLRDYYYSISDKENDYSNFIHEIDGTISVYEAEIERLKKLIEKLENLASADSSAAGMINGVSTDISSYNAAINGIDASTFVGI